MIGKLSSQLPSGEGTAVGAEVEAAPGQDGFGGMPVRRRWHREGGHQAGEGEWLRTQERG